MAKSAARFIAVLGRTRRVGRWKVSDANQVIAILGKCHLDLTEAFVDDEAEEVSMSVLTIFGSVSMLLPEGSKVRPSGIAVLAADAIDLPTTDEVTALAPLNLTWAALFARVRVTQEVAEADAESQEPEQVELVVVPKPDPVASSAGDSTEVNATEPIVEDVGPASEDSSDPGADTPRVDSDESAAAAAPPTMDSGGPAQTEQALAVGKTEDPRTEEANVKDQADQQDSTSKEQAPAEEKSRRLADSEASDAEAAA